MQKNKIYETEIVGYTAEGMGVARVEGMAVFVPNSAMGDRAKIKIVKTQKNFAYGIISELIRPSEARITPQCPAFPKCGGCTFLHLNYNEELRLKGQRVEDALRRIGGFDDIHIAPAHPSTRNGYRNKAQFPLTQEYGRTFFGFYRARSHDVVPTDHCIIQSPRANALAKAVCRWMDEYGVKAYNEETGEGLIRHVYVRDGEKGCHLCLVATSRRLPHADTLIDAARMAAPDLEGIVININTDRTNRILGSETVTLWGKDRLTDDLLGLKFELSPLSFYQVNHTQAQELYRKALEYAALKSTDTALDLYCGVGTITLLLARCCKQAIGNEIVPQAVDNANENAARNGIENARFILGDAGKVSETLKNEGLRPDVIVCDPPRKGMDELTIDSIAAMAPERIVYVSCDPASLARDARMLCGRGYALKKAEAFDMFPGTANVETVVLLSRKTPDDTIEVDLDLDELDITSAESKATYQEIKDYVLKEYGLKVSTLYISQIKRKCGIDVGEHYNISQKENQKVPQCPKEKEDAIRVALEHFAMI